MSRLQSYIIFPRHFMSIYLRRWSTDLISKNNYKELTFAEQDQEESVTIYAI